MLLSRAAAPGSYKPGSRHLPALPARIERPARLDVVPCQPRAAQNGSRSMQLDKRWGWIVALLALVGLYFALDLGQYLSLDVHQEPPGATRGLARRATAARRRAVFFAVYVAVTGAVAARRDGADARRRRGLRPRLGHADRFVRARLGATLAFLTSRWLLRDWVQARFGERLAAINDGVRKRRRLLPLHAAPACRSSRSSSSTSRWA